MAARRWRGSRSFGAGHDPLDLMMPEMDGFEVLDALAAHGNGATSR